MAQSTVLVTGGYGCIGAETVKWLLRRGDIDVVLCSRRVSDDRTSRVFHGIDCQRLTTVELDVTDSAAMGDLMAHHPITHVVHLAALQTPDCQANRDLGLQINLAATQHLIEAMKAHRPQLKRFVFASSVAVYGPRAEYPPGPVPMLAPPKPVNVYGVWKLAGEHLSRIFHEETGIPTVCLRPGVLYGPGRDAGLTSTPTTAMKHLVLGKPYDIPFRSRQDYLYAPDVGAAFGHTLIDPFVGFGVFTLPSQTRSTEEFVAAMRNAADRLDLANNFDITVGDEEVPFICQLDYQPFVETFPDVPRTTIEDGIHQSLTTFLEQHNRGWMDTIGVSTSNRDS